MPAPAKLVSGGFLFIDYLWYNKRNNFLCRYKYMGLIISKKNNNSGSKFGVGKILYKKPTERALLKNVLPRIKVSGSTDKAKFKKYFKEMAGSSIREMTKEIKKRDEFETRDKKKLLGAFMKHYAPETKEILREEEIKNKEIKNEKIRKNINVLSSEEKAEYIKEKGGIKEGVGAKSRLERLEKAKMGILTEDFTKTTSAAGHDNKKDLGAPHLINAPVQPSAGILANKNKIPFASAKSPRIPGGFVSSPGNKPAGGSLKNLPPTLPENKPRAAIPFSK